MWRQPHIRNIFGDLCLIDRVHDDNQIRIDVTEIVRGNDLLAAHGHEAVGLMGIDIHNKSDLIIPFHS